MDSVAEALSVTSWPQAVVLIVTALVPAIIALISWLRARDALKQRDAMIEGVERAGHQDTKRQIQVAASSAGIEPKLKETVKKMTAKLKNGSALLLVFLLPLMFVGCCHDLQRPYVESMEKVRKAIEIDIQHGLYRPDARSTKTLEEWKQTNEDAFQVLIASEQKEGF